MGIARGSKFVSGIVTDPKRCGRTVEIDGDRIGFDDIGEDFDGVAYGFNRRLRCRGREKCEIDNSYADCGNRKRLDEQADIGGAFHGGYLANSMHSLR